MRCCATARSRAVRSDILEGLRRMKASGADVVLIDPQFAPKVLAKKDADAMVDLLATTAKTQNVDLFRRFAVMRHWRQVARLPFEAFISPDELHMNDWSYGCLAKLLARRDRGSGDPLDADRARPLTREYQG